MLLTDNPLHKEPTPESALTLANTLAQLDRAFDKAAASNAARRARMTPKQLAAWDAHCDRVDALRDAAIEADDYSNGFADQVRGDYRVAQMGAA